MIATVLFLVMTGGPVEAAPTEVPHLTPVACRSGHATDCTDESGGQSGSKQKQKEG